MISALNGKILFKNGKFLVLDVGGVGYKIFSHSETLNKIPEIGQTIKVWTHLFVSDDALNLYGFLSKEEIDFFEILISVPGIGPKSALGVLEVAPVRNLKQAIVNEDETFFTKVSGIGRKTAERLILELKHKLAKEMPVVKGSDSQQSADALEALVGLGYKERDARKILQELPENVKTAEEKVKRALKQMGKR